jgi:ribosomal protein L4
MAAKVMSFTGGGAKNKFAGIREDEPVEHAAKSSRGTHSGKLQEQSEAMHVNDVARVRNLEIENEALKKLLTEAYMEIAALKGTLGV